MRSLRFCLFFMLVGGCANMVQAVGWTRLVEELAERAAASEARTAERKLVLRETEEAADVITRRLATTADEAAMLRRFERLQGVDSALSHEFKALPAAERRIALELGEGAQRVLRLHPGVEGTRVLQHLDAAGLAQTRTYGDFVVEGMAWLESDEALAALRGSIPADVSPAIMRTLGLKSAPSQLGEAEVAALWKSVIRKTGNGAGEFWTKYIVPHKEKWLVGGLLVTYLAMPEKFHDALGNLTEYATRELAKLGVSATTGAGHGLLGGARESIARQYAADPFETVATLVLIAVLLLLAIPRLRWLVWHKGLRRLLAAPTSETVAAKTTNSKEAGSSPATVLSKHTPLEE
ncbi:MAG: hypothetical protein GXY83_00995 [Rhodopirellula sp.]|nr:hypothetical protein [Rhodopirellula sp.]